MWAYLIKHKVAAILSSVAQKCNWATVCTVLQVPWVTEVTGPIKLSVFACLKHANEANKATTRTNGYGMVEYKFIFSRTVGKTCLFVCLYTMVSLPSYSYVCSLPFNIVKGEP